MTPTLRATAHKATVPGLRLYRAAGDTYVTLAAVTSEEIRTMFGWLAVAEDPVTLATAEGHATGYPLSGLSHAALGYCMLYTSDDLEPGPDVTPEMFAAADKLLRTLDAIKAA